MGEEVPSTRESLSIRNRCTSLTNKSFQLSNRKPTERFTTLNRQITDINVTNDSIDMKEQVSDYQFTNAY